MSGYSTYLRLQSIDAQAKAMGFRLGNPKHGHWSSTSDGDMVAIFPNDEALPSFSRDAEIFCGSFRDIEIFLAGWARSQQYDMILRMTDDKRRKKYEDAERARQAEQRKREEQKKIMAVLKTKDHENLNPKK